MARVQFEEREKPATRVASSCYARSRSRSLTIIMIIFFFTLEIVDAAVVWQLCDSSSLQPATNDALTDCWIANELSLILFWILFSLYRSQRQSNWTSIIVRDNHRPRRDRNGRGDLEKTVALGRWRREQWRIRTSPHRDQSHSGRQIVATARWFHVAAQMRCSGRTRTPPHMA